MDERKRLAILISGKGSNMEAILQATKEENYPASLALVISDNKDAGGLKTASEAGISSFAFPRSDYDSKSEHEAAIAAAIDAHSIDLICLAGYMRLLSPEFTKQFDGRIINIHPSLLPKFKGLDTHVRAIEAGERRHGCTIHYVNEEMDGGEIIAQAEVPVFNDDTPETLAARVLIEEHKLYPSVINRLCNEMN